MTQLVRLVSRFISTGLGAVLWFAFRKYFTKIIDIISFEAWNAIPFLELVLVVSFLYGFTGMSEKDFEGLGKSLKGLWEVLNSLFDVIFVKKPERTIRSIKPLPGKRSSIRPLSPQGAIKSNPDNVYSD